MCLWRGKSAIEPKFVRFRRLLLIPRPAVTRTAARMSPWRRRRRRERTTVLGCRNRAWRVTWSFVVPSGHARRVTLSDGRDKFTSPRSSLTNPNISSNYRFHFFSPPTHSPSSTTIALHVKSKSRRRVKETLSDDPPLPPCPPPGIVWVL